MYQYLAYTSFLVLCHFAQEAFAEFCAAEDTYCHAPYRCCELKKGCCYDQMLHSNRHFRLQIWNLWYFWFLIIFMMMSCFGGCGYYRRRRLAVLTRPNMNDNRPLTIMPSQHRIFRGQPVRGREFTLLTYNHVNANAVPVTNLPPSYTEIVDHPEMYPSTKIELPPYTEPEKLGENAGAIPNPARGAINGGAEASLPPPYSECPAPSRHSDHMPQSEHQGGGNPGQRTHFPSNNSH